MNTKLNGMLLLVIATLGLMLVSMWQDNRRLRASEDRTKVAVNKTIAILKEALERLKKPYGYGPYTNDVDVTITNDLKVDSMTGLYISTTIDTNNYTFPIIEHITTSEFDYSQVKSLTAFILNTTGWYIAQVPYCTNWFVIRPGMMIPTNDVPCPCGKTNHWLFRTY